MTDVSITAPDGGEVITLGPARIRVLEEGAAIANRLGICEITLAPNSDGPPQHRHAEHDEGFYVIAGTSQFTVGSRSHLAPAGTFVMVPPGAPHTFSNPGDEPLVMLNTFTPGRYVQYFRDLRDKIAADGETLDRAAAEVMPRYDTTAATDFA
jgi:mannose-6-phosphate isomerase-like protein (cupin superfamily)